MMNCKYIAPGLSYEDYLIEILNWSDFFRNKSRDKSEYNAPKSQDSGEADAYSTEYQLDFKLLVDEEVMWRLSQNRPTVNKEYIKQGIIIVNDNPNPKTVPKKNILFEIIGITLREIEEGLFSNNTAKHFIKNLEKPKNLFLYYPYEYFGDKIYSFNAFGDMFTQIFKIPLSYRENKYPDKDTFICIKVNENFLIFEWKGNAFVYRDKVNEVLCFKYREYKAYSFF